MIRPPRLRPGDRVAVVAPAGPVPRERFQAGAEILAARYRLVYGDRIFAKHGFLAGSDEERVVELNAALADPDARAVFVARGGYGLMRILSSLDAAAFLRAPKPIVGFSDVTALHAWAAKLRIPTVHGPVITQLGDVPDEDERALAALLEGETPAPLTGLRALSQAAPVEGRLFGGNLELISRLIGTPFAFGLDGAILLLEEVGERPYRIDRSLTQLLLSGALARVRAVVVGDLHRCLDADGGPTAEEVVAERLGPLGIPIVFGAPVGHGARNHSLPLGVQARLDATAGTLQILESPVQ